MAGLGRTLGAEMLIPFPGDDEPRRAAADFLHEGQRLLGGNEIDSAVLQMRNALETIKDTTAGAGGLRTKRNQIWVSIADV